MEYILKRLFCYKDIISYLSYFFFLGGMSGLQNMMRQFQSGSHGGAPFK